MSEYITVDLPRRFWLDHAERDLPSGRLLGSARQMFQVYCDAKTLREIRNDALYYASALGPSVDPGLKSSARATARRATRALKIRGLPLDHPGDY